MTKSSEDEHARPPREEQQDRYHLCMTCGRLKHENLFEIGDCTCADCYNADESTVRYREAPDGNGFIAVSHEANDD